MKNCLNPKLKPLFNNTLYLVCLIFIWSVLALFIYAIKHGITPLLACLYFVICVLVSFETYVITRQYAVSKQGLTIRYAFGRTREYRWDEFEQVALCKVHFNRRSGVHRVVIRCTKLLEAQGPRNTEIANEKWSSELYEVRNWQDVISIEYTEERYQEFAAVYPYLIEDYRFLKMG